MDDCAADTHKAMGNAFLGQGRLNEAKACFEQAVKCRPDFAEAHNNLGYVHKALGDREAAAACLRHAIRLKPELVNAHFLLGQILSSAGDDEGARVEYETAISLMPAFAEAHFELGLLLLKSARATDGESELRTALALAPENPAAHIGLAEALRLQGRLATAQAACMQALRLDAGSAEAHCCLGRILQDEGRLADAQAAYEQALSIENSAETEFNLALLLLLRGDLLRGFRHLEARWDANGLSKPAFRQPLWRGESLLGKRILVYFEYGFGDTLQFVRYVPELARSGAHVVLGCQQPLVSLMRSVEGVAEVVRADSLRDLSEAGHRLDFDYHVPLWSLPQRFGTSLETVPAHVPYVTCAPEKVEHWRGRIDADDVQRQLRIGLVWKGNRSNLNDKTRSIPVSLLAPLGRIPGVIYFSLQKDAGRDVAPFPAIDHTLDLCDFSDTAALCQNLDLIVSVDTAVAHLAGALGKPVWLLNRFESEWRWLWDRDDSPWYPTMRIFRQRTAGDWAGTIDALSRELEKLARR